MKKINYFFAAAMICMSVAACVKEAGNDNPGVNSGNTTEETIPDNYIELTFQVPGMDVKTSVDGKTVSWTAGDKIRICWDGGSSVSNAVVLEEGNASFTAMVEPEATDFYAVYPSTIEATVVEDNFNVTIPSSQSGRFADADIIVAKTSKENLAFAFHHAVSLVKFVISDENQKGISRAQFVDLANNSQLTGALSIAFDESNAIASSTVTEDTTLDVIDVTAVQPGDNYMAVLPSKELAGFGLRLGSESKWYSGLVGENAITVGDRLALGTVDTKIHEGDFYIKPDGEGKGTSWEDAGNADFLQSLIHSTQYNGVKNLAKAWKLDGKTIKIAVGEYSTPDANGFTCAMGDISFTVDGGYTGEGETKSQTDTTIIGSKTTDTGKRAFFFYNMKDVTLSNLKMKHNSTSYSGGALYVVGTGLALQNCIFENNKAATNGGAICISGTSVLTCENCTFPNNTSANGGAIRIDADCNAVCTSCDFLGNKGKNGGAICAAGATSFENCTFKENVASGSGGAIWNATDVDLSMVTFLNNTATTNGGAIYTSSTLSADRCKFIGNRYTASANKMSATIRIGGNSMFNACEFRDINSSNKGSSRITYNTETKFCIGMHNCLFFGESGGLGHWSLYSTAPVYLINSTLIDTTTDAVLRSDNENSIFYNNIVINKITGIPALYAPTAASHNYNMVSGFKNLAQNNTEVICSNLPDGEAKTYETMDNGMSYYSWSGSIEGFNKTTKADVADAFKNDENFGKAFYAWLDELVEGDGTALDYDIRGVARTNGYWPGSYQNN